MPKGKQIAWNKAAHSKCTLHTNAEGEYYPVCQKIDTPALIRQEYYPIGSVLQYPNKWGRRKAAMHLLEFKITDAKKQIEDAQKELALLERCYSNVLLWEDDSKL
jgi:hypothetical protein